MTTEEQKISHITSIINQYLTLENEMKELRKAIKERQYKHKLLEESILTFMENDGEVDSIKLSGNNQEIVPITREKIKEVSRKNLMTIVETHLKDAPQLLSNIKQEIENKTVVSEISKIKIKKTSASKLKAQSDLSNALLSN